VLKAAGNTARPLWDLPTRAFHWLVVAAVPLSWWSAESQRFTLHQWLGYTLIVLVCSRIVWGFVGSAHSRFADFLVGPGRLLAYMRGGAYASAGHNPLGGWSVCALLLLLLAQGISGLFNSDDILYTGPLYYAADAGFRDAMGVVHESAFDLLLALVGLHILAVLYHQYGRGEPLLQAMLRGAAEDRSGRVAPVSPWRALPVVLLTAAALWVVLQLAPAPPAVMW
jgi:cytochrome b